MKIVDRKTFLEMPKWSHELRKNGIKNNGEN